MDDFYRNLVCSLPDIVYQVDDGGRFTYLNDSVRALGYSKKELLGQHFGVLIEPRSHQTVNVIAYLSQSDVKSTAVQPQFFNERRTGKRITKHLLVHLKCKQRRKSPILEFRDGEVFATGLYEPEMKGGNFLGTVGVIRESADGQDSTRSIVRIERYYNLLMEYSMELISVIAHDGTILFISKSSYRNLGYEPFDLIGENIMDLIHKDDAWHLTNIFTEKVDYGSDIQEIVFRLKHADSRWRYHETSIMPVRDLNKKHTMCYILHSSDITKRKEAESASEKRELFYRSLLLTSPDAIAVFDNEGDIILINEQGAKLLGSSRYDLIGVPYTSLFLDENKKIAEDVIARVIHSEMVRDFQFILRRMDGTFIPVEASFSAIKNGTDKVEGYLSVFRDISKRRKFEDERKRLEEELLGVIIGRLSDREIELLKLITEGYLWPDQKRDIGKIMDALPGTLDQFVNRIKKKMGMSDIDKIASIAALYFSWADTGNK